MARKGRNKVQAAVKARSDLTKSLKSVDKKYKKEKKEYKKMKTASRKAKKAYKKDRSTANSKQYNQSKTDLKHEKFKLN